MTLLQMSGIDSNSNNKYFCNKCKDRNYLIECGDGCGKIIFRRNRKGRFRRYINNHYANTLIGKIGSGWKGGRTKYKDGYWKIFLPEYYKSDSNGYIKEHIYFYEQYYQCCLLPWGVVHHIIPVSEDYCNNMIYNLMGMTRSEHISLHQKGKPKLYRKIDNNLICCICKNKSKQWRRYNNNHVCNKCYQKTPEGLEYQKQYREKNRQKAIIYGREYRKRNSKSGENTSA